MNANAKKSATSRALLEVILDPRALAHLDVAGWERVLSCARRNGVLAYLGDRARSAGVIDDLPETPRASLLSARAYAARLAQLARWELDRVRRVLQPAEIPFVALKGVAYLLRAMPQAATRLLSDIDILVPRHRLDDAEQALVAAGWKGTNLDPYDQDYYRRWSHELPPLTYPGRMLAVDVHHTICPPVSRLRPDPEQLWADTETSGVRGVWLLSPVDTVLHAAVHLFADSDCDGRFRDLIDLHELLAFFGTNQTFWSRLVVRARQQGLGRPLHYALETLTRVLKSPIPEEARQQASLFRSSLWIDRWMTKTLDTVLTPADPEPWPPAHRARLWLLYVRSHWLRMPAYRLLPHLARKSLRRLQRADSASP